MKKFVASSLQTFFRFFLSLHRSRKTFFHFCLLLYRCRKTFFRFFLSLHRSRKFFFRFFLSLHRCRKTFFGFFYRFIGAGKPFFGFFYRFIGEKNFAQQNCIALFDFFSQKLCFGIALIDTFSSIAAHLWGRGEACRNGIFSRGGLEVRNCDL